MAPEKPTLKSILKRPKLVSTQTSQVPRSGRATSRCAKDPEHVRSTEQLYSTLEEARSLKEKTDNVLWSLKNFKCKSPDSRAASVEAAQKMLSDVKELNVKCLNEQRVLMERLRVKLEASSTIRGIISSLSQEVERKRAELSQELLVHGAMQLSNPENYEGNHYAASKLHQATGACLEDRTEGAETFRGFISSLCSRFKISFDDVPGQLEALDALIASSKENSEGRQKFFLAKKEAAKTRLENLRETLHQIKLDNEISTQNQITRAQEAVQDCFAKNNELILAKTHLEALQAEVRVMNSTLEHFGCPREGNCDTEYLLDRIQHCLELLKTVKIPEKRRDQLRIKMNRFRSQLTSALVPVEPRTMMDEEIQTSLSGAKLSEAIRAHAAKLSKRHRSKKCANVKINSSGKTSKSRQTEPMKL